MTDRSNDAMDRCRAIIEEHSKSFALASRLLPRVCRDDAVVVYAWCRRADDAIDQASSESVGASLTRLRAELDLIESGGPLADPVLSTFARVAERCRLPMVYPRELLLGMEMDAVGTDYRTMTDLDRYCYRVAGVVGLMMCHVLGIRSDDALIHAAHLGMGMQLTNICRDVDEDRLRGRRYLPAELLSPAERSFLDRAEAEMPAKDIRLEIGNVIRRLLARADLFYRSGDDGLRYLDSRSAWAIRTARLVYSGIGLAIARQGYDIARGRAYLSRSAKISRAVRAWIERMPMEFIRRASSEPIGLPTRTLSWEEVRSSVRDWAPV